MSKNPPTLMGDFWVKKMVGVVYAQSPYADGIFWAEFGGGV